MYNVRKMKLSMNIYYAFTVSEITLFHRWDTNMTSMYQVSKLPYRHFTKNNQTCNNKHNFNNNNADNNKIIGFSMIDLLNLRTNVRKKYLKERL